MAEAKQAFRKVVPRELPQHLAASEEWKAWPRKLEAHVRWGLRERQITSLCRTGRLVVWRCPDESLRIDPSQLDEEFGPEGVVQGREARELPAESAQRKEKISQKTARDEWDLDDPLPALVRELRSVISLQQTQITDLIKMSTDPIKYGMHLAEKVTQAALTELTALRAKDLENAVLREELLTTKHIRDLELAKQQAADRRKDETLALLKAKAPALLDRFFATSDLASFVKTLDPMLVNVVLESGTLSEEQASTLRRLTGIGKTPVNGKASEVVQ